MNKKHVAWLAASVAAVTLIAGCGGNADTSNNKDAGKNQKTLILGTEATFPPFESVENDKVVGFDID